MEDTTEAIRDEIRTLGSKLSEDVCAEMRAFMERWSASHCIQPAEFAKPKTPLTKSCVPNGWGISDTGVECVQECLGTSPLRCVAQPRTEQDYGIIQPDVSGDRWAVAVTSPKTHEGTKAWSAQKSKSSLTKVTFKSAGCDVEHENSKTMSSERRLTIARLKKTWGRLGSSQPSTQKTGLTSFFVGKRMTQDPDDEDFIETEGMSHWRQATSMLVVSPYFNYAIGMVIVLNAISIGAQVEYSLGHLNEDEHVAFRVFDILFCIVFTVELSLRLYSQRLLFFQSATWKFNCFDMLLVATQLVEETLKLLQAGSELGWVSILRVLRVARVLRLVRVVHLFRELRQMIGSIGNSLKSLLWTVLLLVLIIFVIAVCITQMIVFQAASSPDILSAGSVLDPYFSSIWLAILALFGSITGGIDWHTIAQALTDEIGWPITFLFTLYICFSVFAMLNVVTGVFVESALQGAKDEKDANLASDVRDIFRLGEGLESVLIREDLERFLEDHQSSHRLKQINMTEDEVRNLYQLIDVDESGAISGEDFISGCLRLKGPPRAIDIATLMYMQRRLSARLEAGNPDIENRREDAVHSDRLHHGFAAASFSVVEETV